MGPSWLPAVDVEGPLSFLSSAAGPPPPLDQVQDQGNAKASPSVPYPPSRAKDTSYCYTQGRLPPEGTPEEGIHTGAGSYLPLAQYC